MPCPAHTPINGTTHIAFVTALANDFDNRNGYIVPAGPITQQNITGVWNGAIQNITEPLHLVYPGTINRIVIDGRTEFNRMERGPRNNIGANEIGIFTHGIGTNFAFCGAGDPGPFGALFNRAFRMIVGYANDRGGARAFKALDRQAYAYFRTNITGQPVKQGVKLANPSVELFAVP